MSKTGLFRSKLQQKFILNQLAHSSFALIAVIKEDNAFELGEVINTAVDGREVKGIVIGKYSIKSAKFIVKWSGFDDVEKWISSALRENNNKQGLVIYLIRLSAITAVINKKRTKLVPKG